MKLRHRALLIWYNSIQLRTTLRANVRRALTGGNISLVLIIVVELAWIWLLWQVAQVVWDVIGWKGGLLK
jgi:hypothetical protein